MRRPAQHHHTGPGIVPAWARPYAGIPAIPGAVVCIDDPAQGGGSPVPAPAPSPADLANRAPQPQPAAPPAPQPGTDDEVLLDHRTNAPMTQAAFAKIMARENAKGRRNVLREIGEATGATIDPDDFDISTFGKLFKQNDAARKAQLTEEQRRSEELATREQALQAREDAIVQRDAETAKARRISQLEAALVRLGAVDLEDKPNLQDAFAMLERDLAATPDADAAAITAAADKLKGRRPELFGAAAPQNLPPAPSGAPAGGNAPRQPASTKNAVKDAARKRAQQMGLRTDAA